MRLVREEDTRTPFQHLRRKELERVLQAEGIQHPPDVPAITARQLLAGAGVSPEKYFRNGGFAPPEVPKAKEPEVQESTAKPVEDMKMHELRSYCSKAGIEWTIRDKKVDLLAKVKAAQ